VFLKIFFASTIPYERGYQKANCNKVRNATDTHIAFSRSASYAPKLYKCNSRESTFVEFDIRLTTTRKDLTQKKILVPSLAHLTSVPNFSLNF
jgi:hypothetical protein